jgi:transposase-like protein
MSQEPVNPANVNGKQLNEVPDPEVVPGAKRRRFSAAYKLRILQEVDACTQHGEIGALLRREGLYSSHLSKWRQQRDAGRLYDKKRGPKADPQATELARLRRENERLRRELEKAELIIDVQKKLSQVLGLTMPTLPDTSETGEDA